MSKLIKKEYRRFDRTFDMTGDPQYKEVGQQFFANQAQLNQECSRKGQSLLRALNENQTELEDLNRRAGFEAGFKAGMLFSQESQQS